MVIIYRFKKLIKYISLSLMLMLMASSVISYAETANNPNETTGKKNSAGEAWRSKEGVGFSLDLDTTFQPQYYDPNATYTYNSYTFSGLEDKLTSSQINTLTTIFESMTRYGFTEEMALGACGNIWTACSFDPSYIGNGYGICQWTGERKDRLMQAAEEEGKDWTNLNVQLDYMYWELENCGYLKNINKYLNKFGNKTSVTTVKDASLACDAWCAEMEIPTQSGNYTQYGYIYHPQSSVLMAASISKHETTLLKAASGSDTEKNSGTTSSGVTFIDLRDRRDNVETLTYSFSKTTVGQISGSFSAMDREEIFREIFGKSRSEVITKIYSSTGQKWIEQGLTEEDDGGWIREYILKDGSVWRINKKAAVEITKALTELIDMGYPLSGECYVYKKTKESEFSHHAVGLAVDINSAYNPVQEWGSWSKYGMYIKADQETKEKIKKLVFGTLNSGEHPYDPANPEAVTQKIANVFRKYDWLWGRDFSTKVDMMHFSLGEVTADLCNDWVTQEYEGLQSVYN